MPAIITVILEFFGKISKIKDLLFFKFRKLILIPVITSQVFLITLYVLYSSAVIAILIFLFGMFFDLVDILKNLTSPNSSNDTTNLAINILSSLGILKAFWDVFSLFGPLIISFFVIMAARLGIKIHKEKLRQIKEMMEYIG